MATTMTPEMQAMYDEYMASGGVNGMPTELYQYAQANPDLGIDRSGNALPTTDPMYNFYNPNPGQTQGVDWFPTDDRNNPAITNPDLYTQSMLYQPTPQATTGLTPPPTGAPPLTPAAPTTTNSQYVYRVRMPDGTEQVFYGITPDLDAALKAGAQLMRPDNTYASMTQYQGGWLADNQPLNQFAGGQLTPEQTAAMGLYGTTPSGGLFGAAGLDPSQGVPGLYNQLLQMVMGLQNVQGTGLDAKTKAALTTQALEKVPAEFAALRTDLATRLLRDNPDGLPRGGDFLRSYGPLMAAESAMKQGLLRDVTLKDFDERMRSLEANRAFGLEALAAAGNVLAGYGNYELGKSDIGTKWEIAKLDSDTRLQLAQIGITSDLQLAQLRSATDKEIASLNSNAELAMNKLSNETQIELMRMKISGDKVGLKIGADLLGAAIANPKAVETGIKWLSRALGIGGAAASAAAGTATGVGLDAAAAAVYTGMPEAGVIGGTTGFGTHLAAMGPMIGAFRINCPPV
jgi:hypothetical protein